ncbi:T9SS type A sorting domain-containing protein [Adhaeribacter radiodurans]|uniref:T9SS type A sorting domain-containing protein n=1 Tax=Adhaeribacter radiodurans TaxID=2745197 RepID=A0A7L7LE75_9BACT|nr:T9SS type A sorting domain-containing protein [Adhaeribacter radiodurans]QMU31047.1 T9SS type A sorting domain-containing protein [Adhaeribacter radiodurans]
MKTPLFQFQAAKLWRLLRTKSLWAVIIILCGFFLTPIRLTAQVKLWDKTFGGSKEDIFRAMKKTSDNGFILGGVSGSSQSGDKSQANKGGTDYWVVKLKADGSKEWDKTFGGRNVDELQSIQQTKDGGYILGGTSLSGKSGDKTEVGKGESDYWIVKLNANGTKIWDKTLGGSNSDWLTTVQQTNDGGYILGGYSHSGKSGDKSEENKQALNLHGNKQSDYWVVKIDNSGNKLWDRTIGGDGNDRLTNLVHTPDGGYLLGGSSNSEKSGDKSEPRKSDCTDDSFYFEDSFWGEPCPDYWIVKITDKGVKQWDKTYGGSSFDILNDLVVSPQGGYLLGGRADSDIGLDKSEPTRDEPNSYNEKGDYWIIKIKADGTKEWDKTFGGNKTDDLRSLLPTPDGGYLLGGYSSSSKSREMSELRKEVESFWVIKIDAQGSVLWDKTFSNVNQFIDVTQSTNEFSLEMALTSDGNCLVAGQAYSGAKEWDKSQAGYGATDFWVVKLGIPNKKVQTITFTPTDQGLSNSPFTLSAEASSGLPVTFKLVSGPATQKGNQLHFTGYGIVVVKAIQAGNATYSPVEHTTSFRVQRFPKQRDKTIGGKDADMLADMVATPDGGYLLAGSSASGTNGDKSTTSKGESDYWLVKVDKDKNKVWDKSYGGSGIETISTIIPTPDGGYLLGGTSDSGKEDDKSGLSKGMLDFWLVKVDADGTKLWDKTIGGNLNDNLTTILATPDGGFLLGGDSKSGKSGDKSESNKGILDENGQVNSDFWVVKIDSEGKKLWDKTLGEKFDDNLTSIIVTPDGNYLVGGKRDIDSDHFSDYWVVKINQQGKQLWSRAYDHEWFDQLTSMIATPDGGYLLAGNSGFEGRYPFWVIKIDANGNKIWDNLFSGSMIPCGSGCDSYFSKPIDIVAIPNGHYLLAGYTYTNQGGDRSEETRGKDDYWLLEIDENGQRISDKSFGSSSTDVLTAMVASPNGGYLLGGYSNSNADWEKSEDSKGDYDFWLVETQITAFPPSTLEAWNLRYGGNSLDNFTTVIQTADGGYLLGGYSSSKQAGDKSQGSYGKTDYWVMKTDADGNKLWDKRYGGSGREYLNSIVPTPDGGFLLGGSSDSKVDGNKTAVNKGGKDMWVVKINSSGEIQWDQSYGSRGNEDLRKIRPLPSGLYLLAGYSDSPVNRDKTQASQGGLDYWLVKIDIFYYGFKRWDKRYGGAANDYLEDAVVLENEDLLLGGTSFSSATGDKSQASQGGSDFWALRINSQGDKLWDKSYGGNDQDQLHSLLSINKDTILLAGQSASGKNGDKSQESKGGKDFWLLQVDGKGEKQWDKTYGGSSDETLRSLISDNDGGYVLGGTSFSGISGDKSQTNQGSSDYWLVKTNNQGEKLWDKRLGGNQQEELRAVWITDDGGYLLGGRSNSDVSGDRTQPSQGDNDFWLVKIAPEKTPIVAERETTPVLAISVKEPTLHLLNAYPNPAREQVTVSFTLSQTQAARVKVYDVQGREITTLFQGEAQANQMYRVEWQASNKPAGLYFLQLQTPAILQQQKLLLTK